MKTRKTSGGRARSIAQSVKRFFTHDFALKALSLALALVIYGVLSPDTDTSALQLIRQQPIQAKNEPAANKQEPPPPPTTTAPKKQEALENPEAPEKPASPETPEKPEKSEAVAKPGMARCPQRAAAAWGQAALPNPEGFATASPEAPKKPETLETPEAPDKPEKPEASEKSATPNNPETPESPAIPDEPPEPPAQPEPPKVPAQPASTNLTSAANTDTETTK